MADYPASGSLSGAGLTQADFKTNIEDFLERSKQGFGESPSADETILVSGVIAPTGPIVRLLPESGSLDDVDTIDWTNLGTALEDGFVLTLRGSNTNQINVIHGTGTKEDIVLANDNDVMLLSEEDSVTLLQTGNGWIELSRNPVSRLLRMDNNAVALSVPTATLTSIAMQRALVDEWHNTPPSYVGLTALLMPKKGRVRGTMRINLDGNAGIGTYYIQLEVRGTPEQTQLNIGNGVISDRMVIPIPALDLADGGPAWNAQILHNEGTLGSMSFASVTLELE